MRRWFFLGMLSAAALIGACSGGDDEPTGSEQLESEGQDGASTAGDAALPPLSGPMSPPAGQPIIVLPRVDTGIEGVAAVPFRRIAAPLDTEPGALILEIRRCPEEQLLEPEIERRPDGIVVLLQVHEHDAECAEALESFVTVHAGVEPSDQVLDGSAEPARLVPPEAPWLGRRDRAFEVADAPAADVRIEAFGPAGSVELNACSAHVPILPATSRVTQLVQVRSPAVGLAQLVTTASLPAGTWLEIGTGNDITYAATHEGRVVARVRFSDHNGSAWLDEATWCAGLPARWESDADGGARGIQG